MATTPTFIESFDNGLGAFSRAWGPGVDTSVPGQLTIWTDANNADSGAMMPPTGASAGFGYGLYTETLKMQGTIGVYGMAGWPSTDTWPGPELDMIEIDPNGVPYGTVHWKDADGNNQYQSIQYNGVDPTQVHTYAMDWQSDHISFYVDGKLMGTVTDHVPADYAHGGENESMGVGTQTFWNSGSLGGKNWITIYEATYTATADGGTMTPGSGTSGSNTPDPVVTPPAPVALEAGSGSDALVLKVSQDAYQGDAQYTVSVDGVQVGGTFTASAWHSAGQSDTLTLKGDWAAGAHQVEVKFLNDAWGGTAATDRNLYVDGATYGGQAVDGAAQSVLSDTKAGGFSFTEAAPTQTQGAASQVVGTGQDALVLKVSQDAYQGDAQYTVTVDGAQVGGTFTASALHSSGDSDTLTLKGDWGAGGHQVEVAFLNDAWGGTADADRNLYVDSASYNGQAVGGAAAALMSAGAKDFSFTDAGAPVVQVGTDGADLFDATAAGGQFTGKGGRDLFVFDAGDGAVTITDFASKTDKLVFVGFDKADVTTEAAASGPPGLVVHYGDAGTVFLAGVSALADRDMVFA